eukprot:1936236-Amphidinium_carterae.1
MDAAPAADFLAMADKLPRRECSQLQAGMEKLRYVTEGFDVTVICGQTGCGKTTCCKAIQRSQGGTSSLPTVQFLDTLDQRRIQAALAEVSSSGNQCAVHIDVSSSAALYAVNKALIDLLLFGVWRNNEDGHMFADACAPKYVIEVPCRADELEEFFPVLAPSLANRIMLSLSESIRFISYSNSATGWTVKRSTYSHDRSQCKESPIFRKEFVFNHNCSYNIQSLRKLKPLQLQWLGTVTTTVPYCNSSCRILKN